MLERPRPDYVEDRLVRAAHDAVRGCNPLTCPHDDGKGNAKAVLPHKGMCAYVKLLGDLLLAKLSELDQRSRQLAMVGGGR